MQVGWSTGRCQVRRPGPLSGKAIFLAISSQAVLIEPINCHYGRVQWVGKADETVWKSQVSFVILFFFFFFLVSVGNYMQVSVNIWIQQLILFITIWILVSCNSQKSWWEGHKSEVCSWVSKACMDFPYLFWPSHSHPYQPPPHSIALLWFVWIEHMVCMYAEHEHAGCKIAADGVACGRVCASVCHWVMLNKQN